MDIQDDHGISALLRGAERRLCTGFGFTEGPVWLPGDGALLFSDIPGSRTHRWRPGATEAEVYREPSGWSNGLTLDEDGNVIAWESAGGAGFKGSRKSTPFAAQVTADSAARKGMEQGLQKVDVYVKGSGSGRETAIRSLQAAGLEVISVRDVTPQAHNGCRPRKRRRV